MSEPTAEVVNEDVPVPEETEGLSKKQKIGIATGTAAALGATAAGLTASGVGATAVAATAASAAATGTAIAATGSTVGAALLAPIAGLSIGVPVVAPVVVGIALIVYILVKKHQKNKELYEVMSQAVELIMRIEKCEILMREILMSTGYISNNVTLNRLLEELMTEILRICPTPVIQEFEKVINAGGSADKRIVSELGKRGKEWTLGLKRLRRFTANNVFTKYRYSLIINKLTMINAFFTTLFAEFTLTKMVLDGTSAGVKINKSSEAVQGLINSLKNGNLLLKGRDRTFFGKSKNITTYGQQENLLDGLSGYLKQEEGSKEAYDQIKGLILKNSNDISAPPLPPKKGGTKKKRVKLNKKK
jgi:hypothetical protein